MSLFFKSEQQQRLFKEINKQFRNPIDFKRLLQRINDIGSISQAGLDVGLLDSIQTQLYYKGYKIAKVLVIVDQKGKSLPDGHPILNGNSNVFKSNGQLKEVTQMTPPKLKTRCLDLQKIFGLIRLTEEEALFTRQSPQKSETH